MEQLKNATYIYKGRPYYARKHGDVEISDVNLYDKDRLMESYEQHNRSVQQYFRFRKEDLLVVNVSNKDDYSEFCEFLGVEQKRSRFLGLIRPVIFVKGTLDDIATVAVLFLLYCNMKKKELG